MFSGIVTQHRRKVITLFMLLMTVVIACGRHRRSPEEKINYTDPRPFTYEDHHDHAGRIVYNANYHHPSRRTRGRLLRPLKLLPRLRLVHTDKYDPKAETGLEEILEKSLRRLDRAAQGQAIDIAATIISFEREHEVIFKDLWDDLKQTKKMLECTASLTKGHLDRIHMTIEVTPPENATHSKTIIFPLELPSKRRENSTSGWYEWECENVILGGGNSISVHLEVSSAWIKLLITYYYDGRDFQKHEIIDKLTWNDPKSRDKVIFASDDQKSQNNYFRGFRLLNVVDPYADAGGLYCKRSMDKTSD